MAVAAPTARGEALAPGQLVALLHRLGVTRATGLLTVRPTVGAPDVLVLRRGTMVAPALDPLGRRAGQRLARLAALPDAHASFDGGNAPYPPGAAPRAVPLTAWARRHLEAQVDTVCALALVRELAGVRLAVRRDLCDDDILDDADRRILAAMSPPRRLEHIWPLARTPRFRLLAFVHYLRGVGAIELTGVAAPSPEPARAAATRVLGVEADADLAAVKRAYHRLARALHPDLHPHATDERRRGMAAQLAAVNAAYTTLAR